MNLSGLKAVLAPLHAKLDAGKRWDQAERLLKLALRLANDLDGEIDRDLLATLAFTFTLRAEVRAPTSTRSSVEAALAEQGWTPLSTRELIRALERMPDKPATDEEKLIVDADTYTQLGLLGLCRHFASGASAGMSLADCERMAKKALNRRVYTPRAQADCQPRRDLLRQLLVELNKDCN